MTKAKPNLKNRAAPEVEAAVVAIAVEQPAWGQARMARELRQPGIEVSPFGVRNIWLRHDLATMRHRLIAARMASFRKAAIELRQGGMRMTKFPAIGARQARANSA